MKDWRKYNPVSVSIMTTSVEPDSHFELLVLLFWLDLVGLILSAAWLCETWERFPQYRLSFVVCTR